ncbi:MAG TPA: hypothetical protein VF623_12470, partial [Segetibacter sp.]
MISISTYNFESRLLFLIYFILYTSINWLTNSSVLTDAYYYSALGNQLSIERITSILDMMRKLQWIGYVALPLFLLLKWFLVSSIIYIGLFLFDKNVSFNSCFKIIMVAELTLVVAALIKLIYFLIYR